MKKLLITLLILSVAAVAWGAPVLYDSTTNLFEVKKAANIYISGVEFGIEDVKSMSEGELKNFIDLMRFYRLGIWMSDEFNMEVNRKLLPRFFKKEPEK